MKDNFVKIVFVIDESGSMSLLMTKRKKKQGM